MERRHAGTGHEAHVHWELRGPRFDAHGHGDECGTEGEAPAVRGRGMPHIRRFAQAISGAAGDQAVSDGAPTMGWTGPT
ncbi:MULTISPECIES: hypothetical protein [unclassified Streptomyces]|uniref:hypothetical protein n=1 Tax=unclassified Streptomyces TaxID=2593676 RepID=UPI002E36D882|nr:hypothetical protein [Streptomyces sp. NBC_01280]WSE12870.1 hypothetical protein OG518_05875 [Streptomyces sp. NBC_01397]